MHRSVAGDAHHDCTRRVSDVGTTFWQKEARISTTSAANSHLKRRDSASAIFASACAHKQLVISSYKDAYNSRIPSVESYDDVLDVLMLQTCAQCSSLSVRGAAYCCC